MNPSASNVNIEGWFDAGTARFYSQIVDEFPSGSSFVEVGVYHGKSLAYLAEQTLLAGKVINLYGVDIWKNYGQFLRFQRNMISCGLNHLVKPIRAPSTMAALSFPAESLDVVYLDGDHRFQAVIDDILAWRSKVKPVGYLAGHDIHLKTVRAAVDKILGLKNVEIWEKSWIWKNEKT